MARFCRDGAADRSTGQGPAGGLEGAAVSQHHTHQSRHAGKSSTSKAHTAVECCAHKYRGCPDHSSGYAAGGERATSPAAKYLPAGIIRKICAFLIGPRNIFAAFNCDDDPYF
jgi:hypothetical protein